MIASLKPLTIKITLIDTNLNVNTFTMKMTVHLTTISMSKLDLFSQHLFTYIFPRINTHINENGVWEGSIYLQVYECEYWAEYTKSNLDLEGPQINCEPSLWIDMFELDGFWEGSQFASFFRENMRVFDGSIYLNLCHSC